MFFHPEYYKKDPACPVRFSAAAVTELPDCAVTEFLQTLFDAAFGKIPAGEGAVCPRLTCTIGIPAELAEECGAAGDPEEFVLVLDGTHSHIYAACERGLVYGMAALTSLGDDLCAGILYDRPVCSVRGYRVYLPGRENIPVFKAMVDFLAQYRFNAVVLEIGGAMEYHRHPEINEKWVVFCDEVYADPKRADVIQNRTYPWAKNSIHCENGDGGVLTQEECRALAAYCRSRGIEVIPEVPTLSHSDYICLAHPELAEMAGDAYPDTYCPSHPDTYRYVFDILDEVIEVFQPRQIHIGHDETYILGACERCRGKDPVELYVGDIRRIKEYLDTKGIQVSMWAEKLLEAYYESGYPIGGTGTAHLPDCGEYPIPALWPCRDRMPEGLLYTHWYWSFGKHHDRVYHDRGYPMFYGNLSVSAFEDWQERIGWGAMGGWVSNWGSFEEEYMQRNIQYFDLTSAAYAFWNRDYDSGDKEKLTEVTFAEAYRHRWQNSGDTIVLRHRTDHGIPHEYFWCGVFIEDQKYRIGSYEITYDDGTTHLLPVKYGTNIGARTIPGYPASKELFQLAGAVLPSGKDGDLWYECRYPNPYPDKKISEIRYLPEQEAFTVEYELLS